MRESDFFKHTENTHAASNNAPNVKANFF